MSKSNFAFHVTTKSCFNLITLLPRKLSLIKQVYFFWNARYLSFLVAPYLVRSDGRWRTTKHISVDNPLIIIALLSASSIVVPGLCFTYKQKVRHRTEDNIANTCLAYSLRGIGNREARVDKRLAYLRSIKESGKG